MKKTTNAPVQYFVGIDGGGSHTRIRIVTAVRETRTIIAERTVGYTAKFFVLGFTEATKRITELIATTAKKKNVPFESITGISIGLAGNGRQRDQNTFRTYIKKSLHTIAIIPRQLRLESDAVIALEGLLEDRAGVVLICGTGAIAIGRTQTGDIVRTGGWGRIIGDEGSGYWIGIQALNAVARALDGRMQNTMLTDAVFEGFPFMKTREPRELRSAIYLGKLHVERAAPLVTQCAARGDIVAKKILTTAAEELYSQLKAMHELHFRGETNVRLAFHGSILSHSPVGNMLRIRLAKRMKGKYVIQNTPASPLDGAIRLLDYHKK